MLKMTNFQSYRICICLGTRDKIKNPMAILIFYKILETTKALWSITGGCALNTHLWVLFYTFDSKYEKRQTRQKKCMLDESTIIKKYVYQFLYERFVSKSMEWNVATVCLLYFLLYESSQFDSIEKESFCYVSKGCVFSIIVVLPSFLKLINFNYYWFKLLIFIGLIN